MTKIIAPANLQAEFETFLIEQSIELKAVDMETLFTALVSFYKVVRVEGCQAAEEQDYLHYEGGNGVPYFERIVYTLPAEIDPEFPDEREKLSLIVGPEFQSALLKVQNRSKDSVNLWSMDFTDAAAFALAVQAQPSFLEAVAWGKMMGEVTLAKLA